MSNRFRTTFCLLGVLLLLIGGTDAVAKKDKKKDKTDPYADYVWPPPPDEPRIKLDWVVHSRADIEAKSRFRKMLVRYSSDSLDVLRQPHDVAFDGEGRLLVTDKGNSAILRFDREKSVLDVLGTKTVPRLKVPLGLDVGADGTIYVADSKLRAVVAFDSSGKLVGLYGSESELGNPTDVAVSPDGSRLFVADAKEHRISVYDRETTLRVKVFGEHGPGGGQFASPTSLTFGPEGNLFVVDQINARVQMLDSEGEYIDHFGERGQGFGQFTRPKDVAVDEVGFIYVTDYAHNNFQIFDVDFTLLTFIGGGGLEPGRFNGITGIDVSGDEIAVVDREGQRLQVFRFIVPKDR